MNRLYRAASAAVVALVLISGAAAASAQTYGFTNPGEPVTVSGIAVQEFYHPPYGHRSTTICNVAFHGEVASDGSHLTLTSQETDVIAGPLTCGDSVELPITLTAYAENMVNLDSFVIFGSWGSCVEENYQLAYLNNEVFFDGVGLGVVPICFFEGALTVTSDLDGDPVLIVANEEN